MLSDAFPTDPHFGMDHAVTPFGGRLDDMGSFQKCFGGSPTNIARGASRLGLRTALISRVRNENMGRFILEQLAREGVNTNGVVTDPDRLTALVLLGIRDEEQFPLIFYREDHDQHTARMVCPSP